MVSNEITTVFDHAATQCSYKMCCYSSDKQLTKNSSRVEVQTFVPKKIDSGQLFVDWHEDGRARFHIDCWCEVVQSCTNNDTKSEPLYITEEKEMVKDARKTAEFFNSDSQIKQEAWRTAQMLRCANHAVVFTGAGISTSAGIGDFRGPGGKWTEKNRKRKYGDLTSTKFKQTKTKRSKAGFNYASLRPTYTHEAISKLVEMGLVKYVMSQNCDGLHRLSGVPRDKISELHGNVFEERCLKCNTRYDHPYVVGQMPSRQPSVNCRYCKSNHKTGRMCEKQGCGGPLINTIINFGDDLEAPVLDLAIDHSHKKDLMLCLGSTLTVTPACDLVTFGQQPIRLVICNRQPTPYDQHCLQKDKHGKTIGSRIYGDCDNLMKEVMACLLTSEDLKEWEEGRDKRMHEYNRQRSEMES